MTIEEYINRIEGFLSLKSSEQIPYLGYYLTNYFYLFATPAL